MGAAGVILVLFSYSLAEGFYSMLLVRVLHGCAHVIMATALMAIIVGYIPREKSGQAFGLLSITTLLPYALVPPVLTPLTNLLGGYTRVLALFGLMMVFMIPITLMAGPQKYSQGKTGSADKLSTREVFENLKNIRVFLILLAMLLTFSGYAMVFFTIAGFGRTIGILDAGLFFTFSTISEIGVRVAVGSWFDKTNKAHLAGWSLLGLGLGYAVLAHASGPVAFFALGGVLGLGWGVAFPVLNALMFDISPVRFRALNTNLGFQMFQGGFFLGPFLGGLILDSQNFQTLFYACAALSLAAAGSTLYLTKEGSYQGVSNVTAEKP